MLRFPAIPLVEVLLSPSLESLFLTQRRAEVKGNDRYRDTDPDADEDRREVHALRLRFAGFFADPWA